MLIQSLVLVCLGLQAQPLPKLVGTLSVTEGKVRFERAGRDPDWAGKYVRLRVGDKLTIVEKPRATLSLDATREVWRLPEKGAWEVQEKTVKSLDGQSLVLVRRGAPLRQLPGKPPAKLAGEIRGDDTAISPIGAVTNTPIVISWNRAPGASKASLDLLDSRGKKLWSKTGLTVTSFALPVDKTKAGTWLQVRLVQSGGGKVTSTSTWVRLLPPVEAKALSAGEKELRAQFDPDSPALGLALGDLWASAGLVSQLCRALEMVWPEYIARPRPQQEVIRAWHWKYGEWLETAGFAALARKEYEAAWEAGERAGELKSAIERLGGKAEVEEWEKLAADQSNLLAQEKVAEALPLGRRIAVTLRTARPNSVELGIALHRLGDLLERTGQVNEAEKALAEAQVILEQVEAPGSKRIAGLYYSQGFVAADVNNLQLAREKWEASLAIFEQLSPGSMEVARCRGLLGTVAYHRGDLALAKQYRTESLNIFQGSQARGSIEEALALIDLAAVLKDLGELDAALKHGKAAYAILAVGEDSPLVAECLGLMGTIARRLGDLNQAHYHFERTRNIYEQFARESPEMAGVLRDLGSVALDQGNLAEAQRFYEDSLAILTKQPERLLDTGRTLMGLGLVALERGDLDDAQRRFESANKILEADAKPLEVIKSVVALGVAAERRGELDLAKQNFNVALKIFREAKSLAGVSMCHTNLGNIAIKKDDVIEARRCFLAAKDIEEGIARDSVGFALTLINLGALELNQGDFDRARQYFREARTIYQKLSPRSPDMAAILKNMGYIVAAEGNQAELIDTWSSRLALTEVWLTGYGFTGADLGVVGLEASDILFKIGWLNDPPSAYSFLPTLRSAGLVLQARAKAVERLSKGSEDVRIAVGALQVAIKRETEWTVNPRQPSMSERDWSDQLIQLRSGRQAAEARLGASLEGQGPFEKRDLTVKTEDVREAISQDSCLLEFLRVSTWDAKSKKPAQDAYAAFIVQHEGDVRYVRLAPADEIDDLVEEWHKRIAVATDQGATAASLTETQKELKSLGRKLYDKLIKPLGKLPPNLLIAPDDQLHTLPFAALVDAKGKYLVETTALSIVGSGRDLVEKPITGEPGPAVVIAGPDFGADAKAVQSAKVKAVDQTMRAFNAKGEFAPLPSADAEGVAIAKLLGTEPIRGTRATEERLLSLERPRVLHIATHGFFIAPVVSREDRENRLLMETGQGIRVADNPMLRSGLILAGANNDEELRKAGLADGWATALEISQMDLRGTELVVLSACETGRGDVKGAEGVFGLQRAFRFAGAQTLVMSLFKVPDDSTRILMENFYKTWKPGAPAGTKQKALRDAQLSMLKNPKTRHPRNWAGFVLMGER